MRTLHQINLECRVLAVIIYLPGKPSKHIREIEFTSESSSLSPYSYTAELPNMAQVKDSSMEDVAYDTPKVATVVAEPVTDVEAPPAGREQPLVSAAASGENADERAGMGLEIALFVLILMGIATFFLPLLSVVCIVAAIAIASVLLCGCCCAGEYHLKLHVRKWAVATLVTLSLTFANQGLFYYKVCEYHVF
jgi:hypothetical protein